jgi:hypothetical protein
VIPREVSNKAKENHGATFWETRNFEGARYTALKPAPWPPAKSEQTAISNKTVFPVPVGAETTRLLLSSKILSTSCRMGQGFAVR